MKKNINVCLFIFFQLKTIFINKNKSDNNVKNPAHPERNRSEFEAFSYPYFALLEVFAEGMHLLHNIKNYNSQFLRKHMQTQQFVSVRNLRKILSWRDF